MASVSGDVRRALELCRKAAELLEAGPAPPGAQHSPCKVPRGEGVSSPRSQAASHKQVGV